MKRISLLSSTWAMPIAVIKNFRGKSATNADDEPLLDWRCFTGLQF